MKTIKGITLGLLLMTSNAFAVDIITLPFQIVLGSSCGFYSTTTNIFCSTSANLSHGSFLSSILLLPFTLLNEENGEIVMDIEALKEQGYNEEEIGDLVSDYQKIDTLLKVRGVKNAEDAEQLLSDIEDELSPITLEVFGA